MSRDVAKLIYDMANDECDDLGLLLKKRYTNKKRKTNIDNMCKKIYNKVKRCIDDNELHDTLTILFEDDVIYGYTTYHESHKNLIKDSDLKYSCMFNNENIIVIYDNHTRKVIDAIIKMNLKWYARKSYINNGCYLYVSWEHWK